MEEQKFTIYRHIGKDSPATQADGAYCISGINGNIFISFFQEPPDIPNEVTIYEDVRDIEDNYKINDPMQKSRIPYWETGEGGIDRFFTERIQMAPAAARLLANNILLALDDMEK